MTPEDFIPTYEKALATQDWKNVGPLIANEASVTFSDGVVHKGKDNVQSAFEKNFATIKSEHYKISNLHWVKKNNQYAVFTFEYNWSGYISDNLILGNGVGTSIIICKNDDWLLLSEHLGKKQS